MNDYRYPRIQLTNNGDLNFLALSIPRETIVDGQIDAHDFEATDDNTPAQIPTPKQIQDLCEQIQSQWNDREIEIRLLRAQMACQYGVCRNF